MNKSQPGWGSGGTSFSFAMGGTPQGENKSEGVTFDTSGWNKSEGVKFDTSGWNMPSVSGASMTKSAASTVNFDMPNQQNGKQITMVNDKSKDASGVGAKEEQKEDKITKEESKAEEPKEEKKTNWRSTFDFGGSDDSNESDDENASDGEDSATEEAQEKKNEEPKKTETTAPPTSGFSAVNLSNGFTSNSSSNNPWSGFGNQQKPMENSGKNPNGDFSSWGTQSAPNPFNQGGQSEFQKQQSMFSSAFGGATTTTQGSVLGDKKEDKKIETTGIPQTPIKDDKKTTELPTWSSKVSFGTSGIQQTPVKDDKKTTELPNWASQGSFSGAFTGAQQTPVKDDKKTTEQPKLSSQGSFGMAATTGTKQGSFAMGAFTATPQTPVKDDKKETEQPKLSSQGSFGMTATTGMQPGSFGMTGMQRTPIKVETKTQPTKPTTSKQYTYTGDITKDMQIFKEEIEGQIQMLTSGCKQIEEQININEKTYNEVKVVVDGNRMLINQINNELDKMIHDQKMFKQQLQTILSECNTLSANPRREREETISKQIDRKLDELEKRRIEMSRQMKEAQQNSGSLTKVTSLMNENNQLLQLLERHDGKK